MQCPELATQDKMFYAAGVSNLVGQWGGGNMFV
jgi:hypothetical protein